jgi:hypothetical protein
LKIKKKKDRKEKKEKKIDEEYHTIINISKEDILLW